MSSTQSTVFPLDLSPTPSGVQGCVPENEDAVLGAMQTPVEDGGSNTKIKEADDTSRKSMEMDSEIEISKPQLPATSTKWTQYQEEMEQLNAAVQRALAVSESEPKNPLNTENTLADVQAVTISIDDSQTYRIPWKACRTWKCMDAFLREWFSKDECALKCIADGNFTLEETYGGAIHPKLWEAVIMPDSHVEFSLRLPPEVVAATPPRVPETKSEPEAWYENRIQYKVSFFKRTEHSGRSEFVSDSVYTEPIELEISNEHDKVPVLEERKQIESAPDPFGRTDFGARRANTRFPKLRQADIVSEPALKIYSPYLLNILKSLVEYSAEPPMGDTDGLDAGLFVYPFRDLYHHLEDLLKYKTEESTLRRQHSAAFNQQADEHIDLLVSYLETQPAVQYKEAKARWSRSTPLTTFATLWLLMKPGTDVYVREADGSFNRYVLDRLIGGTHQDPHGRKITNAYTAQLWNLALDDQSIRQYSRKIEIEVFDDERKITELPVFPAQYHDENETGNGRQAMIDRGRKYFEYSKRPYFLEYSGRGLKPGSRSYKRTRVVVEHASRPWEDGSTWGPDVDHLIPAASSRVAERVPVSPSYSNSFGHPPPPPPPPPLPIIGASIRVARCECSDCREKAGSQKIYPRLKFSEYREIDPTKESGLTEHQYSILPSHMFAFVLNDRGYDLLDVAKLQKPSMAETAIDRLVMRHENKGLIKAVATTYTDNSKLFSADFIYDKGEGQVILLHGPPGTGKTLTAESVAEFTRRPLLNLTAADLGHEPDALEKSLLKYFRRANDWDAVVLLDEADVYLEKRSTNDLKRNSVVSVFLRALDYFQGILFLTTNRVGHFDEAFMSRIHLSLGYDKLNDEARAQIWGNMFQKLKDDHKSGGARINYDYDAKRYVTKSDEVKALEWNGREIRNAFQTAVALAVYDSKHNHTRAEPTIPEVTEDHLRQVVEMSSAFRKYITAAHEGMDDSVLAYKYGNRDDGVSTVPGR